MQTAFASGSCKTAENKDSLFIVSSRNKLLGHKIHSIVQGSHQTKIRCLVEGLYFAVAMMPAE